MKNGTFCISLDTELLWGRLQTDQKPFLPRAKKTRKVIEKLLQLFDKHNIPVTWAIVGNLFLAPNKNEKNSHLWHAPDIIKKISSYKIHEIACHSYSHPDFDKISKIKAEAEIKQCITLAQKHNITLRSFVFPKNIINHLDLLKKHGFQSYRSKDKRNWELLFPSPPPVYKPTKTKSLVAIPGSMYFTSSRGIKKYIPGSVRVLKAKMGIDQAIKQKKVFHIWFHPIDLTDEPTKLLNSLEKILIYADKQRKTGKLDIKTMQQISKTIK